jgi:hypothetical protein
MRKILILGNGSSRLNHKDFVTGWDGEIWVCNAAYKEYKDYPRLDVVGTVHGYFVKEVYDFKIKNKLSYKILCNELVDNYNDLFLEYNGWSTGSELINQAFLEGAGQIYVMGFDSFKNDGADIYNVKVFTGNFISQTSIIFNKFKVDIKKINFKEDAIRIK